MNNTLSVILITISLLASIFYTRPLFDEITALGEEKASLDGFLNDSKNLRNILAEKESAYNNLDSARVEDLNILLPDNINNIKLIKDIDDIAKKHNMKMRNIDIKAERAGEFNEASVGRSYGVATIRFSVSTNYDSFKIFMTDLENSLRLVDITSLSFNAGDKGLDEYNVELKTYWLKEVI